MDPNETLKRIDAWLTEDYRRRQEGEEPLPPCPEIDEWCRDLYDWIKKGGFAPDWDRYPLGESYYRCQNIDFDNRA